MTARIAGGNRLTETVLHVDYGRYSISDGRHRVIGAIIAGRPDVLCELEDG